MQEAQPQQEQQNQQQQPDTRTAIAAAALTHYEDGATGKNQMPYTD